MAKHVASITAKLNATKKKSSKNLKVRDHVKDLKVDGGMVLTRVLKKQVTGFWT